MDISDHIVLSIYSREHAATSSMVRLYTRPYKPYLQEDMDKAIMAVANGLTLTKAAKEFSVPRSTLSMHFKRKRSLGLFQTLSKVYSYFLTGTDIYFNTVTIQVI